MIASFVQVRRRTNSLADPNQVFIESVKRCIEAFQGEAEVETLSWIGMGYGRVGGR